MADGVDRNSVWAGAFLDEVARAGVVEVCISPGSRSTPLVLACARDSRFRTFVHLDERSSAYFALGIGKASGRPALVVTTSGTAAANLFPAVVEASQAEVPLLIATADRPSRLRGADANQAIDQLRLYGSYVRAFFEVAEPNDDEASLRHLRALASRGVALAMGLPAGPVHLNFPFSKPLEPPASEEGVGGSETPGPTRAGDAPIPSGGGAELEGREGRVGGRRFTRITATRPGVDPSEVARIADLLDRSSRGLLMAGPSGDADALGPAARRLARAASLPLLADPLSGARFGAVEDADPAVISGYDLFLRDPSLRRAMVPDVIVRVGATPTSAAAQLLLDESRGAQQLLIDGGGRWKDHLARVDDYVRSDAPDFLERVAEELLRRRAAARATPARPADQKAATGTTSASPTGRGGTDWLDCWRRAERLTREVVERELEGELFEGTILAAVAAGMEEGESLFVSGSMPIRDLDAFGAPGAVPMRVFGNRGASGIDGIVSTALGVAAGGGARVTAVVGDIAFYHDMNGLLATRTKGLDVTFVVIHNDGGGIFNMLPIREHEPDFTPFFATPHGLDFHHVAALYDLPFTSVADVEELRAALVRERSVGGCGIVEVRTDREENRRRHQEVADAVRCILAAPPE